MSEEHLLEFLWQEKLQHMANASKKEKTYSK